MTRKTVLHTPTCFIILLLSISFFACNNATKKIPFPDNEMEYTQPVSRSYKLGDSTPIKWTSNNTDSIKPSLVRKFDYTKLPSKPFDIGSPYQLKSPTDQINFDWNSLPDTAFDYKNLPTQPLKFKTVLIQRPKIIKASLPSPRSGASRGVLQQNITQNFSGIGRCFLQDEMGFMWIGTDKGLCRFDGTNIELYSSAQGIFDSNIWSIAEDSSKNIWMGTASGEVFILDRKAGLVHQLIDSFPHGEGYGILKDKHNQMWITRSNQGVIIVNTSNATIKKFSKKEGLSNDFTLKIIQDKKGLIWISSLKGVTIVDETKHQIKKINKSVGLNNEQIYAIHEDTEDNIWLGGNGGAFKVNIQKGIIHEISKKQGLIFKRFVSALSQDKNGMLWIGTDSGVVFKFNPKANTLERIIVVPGDNNIVYNLLEDWQGQIWMGTTRENCYTINTNFGRPANYTKANGLGDNRVWGVLEATDGKMWITTYNGIDIYDPTTSLIKHIGTENGLHNPGLIKLLEAKDGRIWAGGNGVGVSIIDIQKGTIEYLGKDQGVISNGVNVLFEESNGNIWIGSGTGEIAVYNPSTKQSKQITNLVGWKGANINTILVDYLGKLWISSYGKGVLVINKERNSMQLLTTSQGLISNASLSLLEDDKKQFWIGTEKGVDVLNQNDKTIFSFTPNEGLLNESVWTLNYYNNKYYLGTSAGLCILENKSKSNKNEWRVLNYSKEQGLTYVDFAENGSWITRKGQFWAGIDNQILTVLDEPKSDSFVGKPYISTINIFDKHLVFTDKNYVLNSIKNIDTLWMPSNESLYYPNKQLPLDTSYLQQNKIKWDSISNAFQLPYQLKLPYNQNYINFSFTSAQYFNADQIKYRYILEGIDKNWSAITENNYSENYKDLPPGEYYFKVASKNMNGIWSQPAVFYFTILSPWWKSWWAYSIYLLLFAGVLRGYIIFRSKNLRRQNQLLEDKVASRTDALQKSLNDLQETQKQLIQSEKMASLGELTAGIAHEIQNPLNFVNNFSEVNKELLAEMNDELTKGNIDEAKSIAKDVSDNEEKIIFHGKRADSIVKGMLQHSRASNSVKEPTDINSLCDEYLRLSYHGLRAKDKSFNATFKTDFDHSVGKINIVSQDIGRVILNLLTNAFYAVGEKSRINKDGYEPTVLISTQKIDNIVEIRVIDNGNGITQKVLDKIFQPFFTTKPTGQGTGLGLSMSYEIITKAHGGTLTVETKEGQGSTFIIKLPS